LVARPSTLLVLDPATLSPRDQFIGLVCEEAAAGVDGSRVVLAGLGKLSVLDLQRNILTHRVDRAASRALLDGRYRQTDLAAELKSPAVWPDGESFFALSDGRACQFYFESNSLYLTYVGPRRGRVRATAVGSASEGDGLFLMEPIPIVPTPIVPNTSAPDPSPDGSEAAWFAAYSPEGLFDTATIQERIVGVAKSGAENGPAFFLSQSGRCSRYPAQDNRLLGQIDLLGNGESAELSPRYCGIVADPRHPRAAVFNDESLWIVESAVDDNADAAE
jgi:hypothetical protein